MSKISIRHADGSLAETKFKDIPVGTVFTGVVGAGDQALYLRAFGSVVCLSDPYTDWSLAGGSGEVTVDHYLEVDLEVVVRPRTEV